MATLAERAAAAQARLQPKADLHEERSLPSAPVKLNKALQAEADYDGAVERVEVDGLAVLKILQHASGALNPSSTLSSSSTLSAPLNAAGFLFGLALGDKLSISNAFALPAGQLLPSNITTIANVQVSSASNADERTKASKVAAEREKEVDAAYRNAKSSVAGYLPRAKELNLDSEVVGGYFVSKDGMDLLKEGVLVDILIRFQFGLASTASTSTPATGVSTGQKSVGAPKQQASLRWNRRAVAIIYDASSSTSSSVSLKAYSLSQAFLRLYDASSSFSSHRFDYASLASANLSPASLLSSYPVTVTSSSLLTAFLTSNPTLVSSSSAQHSSSYSALSASESLEYNLRSLIGAVDSANSSIQSLGYQGRAARYGGPVAGGLATIDNLNRLDSLKTIAVADSAARALGQEAGLGTVRAWAAKSSTV